MSVTLSGSRALTRILKLIELVPPAERSWLRKSIDAALRGSSNGSNGGSPHDEPPNEPHGEPQVQMLVEPTGEPRVEQVVVSCFFEEFWKLYPRKQGKQDALRIYKRLKPNQELQDRILKAVHEQKASEQWTKENGQFIPLPKTWLNRGSWDDEPQVHRPKFGRTDPAVFDGFIRGGEPR